MTHRRGRGGSVIVVRRGWPFIRVRLMRWTSAGRCWVADDDARTDNTRLRAAARPDSITPRCPIQRRPFGVNIGGTRRGVGPRGWKSPTGLRWQKVDYNCERIKTRTRMHTTFVRLSCFFHGRHEVGQPLIGNSLGLTGEIDFLQSGWPLSWPNYGVRALDARRELINWKQCVTK